MCVGCRGRDAKTALLRVVVAANEIVPDPRARLAGRGAYLHLRAGCADRALRKRALRRALRAADNVGDQGLREWCAKWN